MLGLSIKISQETVKAMREKLQEAYRAGDIGMVKRMTALLRVSRSERAQSIAEELGCAVSSIYQWLKQLVYEGVAGLTVKWRGGRHSKLTKSQKSQLADLIKAGPQAAGFKAGGWNATMIQELMEREFGVLYNVQYVSQLLKQLGFSFQKARFVADHLDEAKRQTWLSTTWPTVLAQAKAVGGLILFGDEASFAQWGSLGYTWAPIGQQPLIKTTGKRKAYKVFGLIEFFSGRLFYQGIQGKFNADSYTRFLSTVLDQTTQPLFLIQDGAPYHRSAAVHAFLTKHAQRLTVFQLPSYSPDYNPIEYLWRATKRDATHLHYFPEFTDLVASVEDTLSDLATQHAYVQSLFTLYLQLIAHPLSQEVSVSP